MTKWIKLGAGIAIAKLSYTIVAAMTDSIFEHINEYISGKNENKTEEADDVPAGE